MLFLEELMGHVEISTKNRKKEKKKKKKQEQSFMVNFLLCL
jgi:hypothetical protein